MKIAAISVQRTEPEPRMHKRPCTNCPSAHYPPDPEAQDIMQAPFQVRLETAFPCAWAPVRFCRGYCDQMGISDGDLAALATSSPNAQGTGGRDDG